MCVSKPKNAEIINKKLNLDKKKNVKNMISI